MAKLIPVEGDPFEEPQNNSGLEEVHGDPFQPNKPVPQSLLDRLDAFGEKSPLGRIMNSAGEGARIGFGTEQLGFSPENEKWLDEHGLGDTPGGPMTLGGMMGEKVKDIAAAGDGLFRLLNAGLYGAAGFAGQTAVELGADQGMGARLKRDIVQAGTIAMLLSGDHPIARVERSGPTGGDGFHSQPVGRLPQPIDFHNSAAALTEGKPNPAVESKLNRIWQERGIHPAEAVADAQKDPVLMADLLSRDPAIPDAYFSQNGISSRDLKPNLEVFNKYPDVVATRVLKNGTIVPAPEAVADYLQKFGDEAGFKFLVGPEEKLASSNMQWSYRRVEFNTGKVIAHVYIPETSAELTQRWYGMNPTEIIHHEVGHALDSHVINENRGTTKVLPKDIKPVDAEGKPTGGMTLHEEIEAASRKFRPKLWDESPEYNAKPSELMADAIAQWISNPEVRKQMPLFTEKYGAKLDKYREIAERALPKRVGDRWEAPPGKDEYTPGAGGSGGGSEPPVEGGGRGGAGEPPRRIEGPYDMEGAGKKLDEQLDVGGRDPNKDYTWSKLYTDTIDKFFPIRQATAGEKLTPGEDPYKLARLFAGWAGKAERMIHEGTFDFNTYDKNGPSLDAILAPVKNDIKNFRRFAAAARAMELELRGIEHGFDLKAVETFVRGGQKKYAPVLEKLINFQNKTTEYLKDSGVLSEKGYAAMLEANKLYVPFHVIIDEAKVGINRVGSSLQPSNPVKRIEGSNLKKIDPLESIIKNTYLLVANAEKNVVGTKLIDMLLGGDEGAAAAGRPRTDRQIKAIADETTGKAVANWIGHNGGPKLDPLKDVLTEWATPEKKGEISIFRDGKRETYRVDDELARSFKSLDVEAAGMLERILSAPARSLRAGAVLDPAFQARHTFRDMIYGFITYDKGIFNPLDMAKGFTSLIAKDKDFWDWKAGGGSHVSLVSLDRRYMQEGVDKVLGTGLFTRSWNVVVDPEATWLQKGGAIAGLPARAASKLILHPLQLGTELVTSASHLGAFKKRMRYLERNAPETSNVPAIPGQEGVDPVGTRNKANILDAAWTSRDTSIDNQRIGAKTKAWNMISTFANAAVQDTAVIAEKMIKDPTSTFIKLIAGVTLPSVLLWAMNHSDSRVKDLPEWEKDIFWHIPTDKWEDTDPQTAALRMSTQLDMVRQKPDGTWQQNNGIVFRLPKPFATGIVFGSVPERMLDAFVAGKEDAFKGIFTSIWDAVGGNLLIPTAASPVVDQLMNRSSFTGRTLIPGSVEGGLPEYQYTEYTTEAAKMLGKVIGSFPGIKEAKTDKESTLAGGISRAGSSPILIENYVRGWAGSLGVYALQTVDYGLRKAGIVPDDKVPPAMTLADYPIVKAFVSRYPSMGAQPIADFYSAQSTSEQYYKSFQDRAKLGDVEAMQKLSTTDASNTFAKLDGYKLALTRLTQTIHGVNRNPDMSPSDKRQLIDTLYYRAIQTAREGIETSRLLKRSLDGVDKTEPAQ